MPYMASLSQNVFFKLFPPPSFLLMPHAGIDISDDAVRIIQFSYSSHGLKIAKSGFREFPAGMVEAGYINDEPGVTKIIAELARELGVIYVKASLPEEKTYLFKSEIPSLDEKEIRQNIEFKLEENVPVSPANAIFSFEIIPTAASAGSPLAPSTKHTAMVSVAPRKVIDAYLQILEGARLTPISFEVQARAVSHALISPKSSSTSLVVEIMHHKTGLYVICEGVVAFTSTIPWGSAFVTEAIAKALSITPAEAAILKKNAGYHDAKDTQQISVAIDPLISSLQKEIFKIYGYWADHGEGRRAIDNVILCGSDALLVGLLSQVAPEPHIPVTIGNVWTNAFSSDYYIPTIPHEDSLDYAAAVGLALP